MSSHKDGPNNYQAKNAVSLASLEFGLAGLEIIRKRIIAGRKRSKELREEIAERSKELAHIDGLLADDAVGEARQHEIVLRLLGERGGLVRIGDMIHEIRRSGDSEYVLSVQAHHWKPRNPLVLEDPQWTLVFSGIHASQIADGAHLPGFRAHQPSPKKADSE